MENNNNNYSSSSGNGGTLNGGTQNRGPLLGITGRNNSIISFLHNTSIRLGENNFLLWKQHILTAVHGYGLEQHLVEEDQVPPMFKSPQDEETRTLNPEFIDWRRQDQLLMSWLLAPMSEGMLTRVVGYNFACEI